MKPIVPSNLSSVHRWALRAGALACSLIVGSAALCGPSSANLPGTGSSAGVCVGATASHLVKRYYGVAWGHGSVPLRCGMWFRSTQRGWGYRKLVAKGRWNVWWDGMIGATMQSPSSVTRSGTSTTFKTKWFTNCSPVYRFVVVVESRPTPQGVATGINNAYQQIRTN